MSNIKEETVEVNGYGVIAANYEAGNIFSFLSLHMFHTHSKNVWN